PRLFVLGKFEGGAIRSPSWTSLVLSHKTRDEVLGSAQKTGKGFLIGGASALAVGVILGVVSVLIGGGKGGDGASLGKPVLVAAANGATLDANARAAAGFRRVAGASDAVTVAVRPGGAIHASELNLTGDGPCVGWTNREPTYRIRVAPGAGALDITATSSDDTTLIVNGPDNRWQC